MASDSSADTDVEDIREIALRWVAAVAASDVEQIGRLMTDDIVVIHGNGRIISGKKAVMADFARTFENFRVKQTLKSEETVIMGDWAFDRARVHTTITPCKGADTKEFDSQTLAILRSEGSRGWCVARSIGVIDQQHRIG